MIVISMNVFMASFETAVGFMKWKTYTYSMLHMTFSIDAQKMLYF